MNNIFESISNTSDKAGDIGAKYLKDTQEYYKLKIFQQLTLSIGMVAKALVIGGLLFIGLIFMSVSLALAIGNYFGNVAIGYLVMATVFLLLAVLLYYKRAIIGKQVIAKMSPKFFN